MKNSRISKACVVAFVAFGVLSGPACLQAVAAESGLMNVARAQDLQADQVWSDSLPSNRVLPSAQANTDPGSALDEDEDVQRYVQMHEDALDSPIRSFVLPWSMLQQIAN